MYVQRTEWVDYAKGIGIILVVYAHLLSSGFHADLPIAEQFFHLSDSIVYSFHMPLFFFLAGLFAQQSLQKRGVLKFCKDKLQVIAYPYLIWSCFQGTAELFFAQQSYRGLSIDNLLSIPYIPLAQFWFLYALFLMYLALALSIGLGRFAHVVLLIIGLLLFFFPLSTEIMALHGFSTGFLFFVIGVLYRNYRSSLQTQSIPSAITITMFVLLMGGGTSVFLYILEPMRLTNGAHPFYFLVLSFIGILFATGLAQYLAQKKWMPLIRVFGENSIQIYLVHMLAGVAVRVILLSFFSIENPVINMVFGVGGGLLIPVALYKISKRLNFPYLFEFRLSRQEN